MFTELSNNIGQVSNFEF